MTRIFQILLFIGLAFWGCESSQKKKINFLLDYEPINDDGSINAVVEISSGTLEKYELNKIDGTIELELINNKPRIINYLGYPANYGLIPKTLLAKKNGGDGDPLDVIVIGPPEHRNSVVKCKVIGVLYLLDKLEQDDKLIAVSSNSTIKNINNIDELEEKYSGILEILEIWFTNYKGSGEVISKGFGDKKSALRILMNSIDQFANNQWVLLNRI